jgi:hypothetical protein
MSPDAIELLFVIIPFGLGWMIAAGVVSGKSPGNKHLPSLDDFPEIQP